MTGRTRTDYLSVTHLSKRWGGAMGEHKPTWSERLDYWVRDNVYRHGGFTESFKEGVRDSLLWFVAFPIGVMLVASLLEP